MQINGEFRFSLFGFFCVVLLSDANIHWYTRIINIVNSLLRIRIMELLLTSTMSIRYIHMLPSFSASRTENFHKHWNNSLFTPVLFVN